MPPKKQDKKARKAAKLQAETMRKQQAAQKKKELQFAEAMDKALRQGREAQKKEKYAKAFDIYVAGFKTCTESACESEDLLYAINDVTNVLEKLHLLEAEQLQTLYDMELRDPEQDLIDPTIYDYEGYVYKDRTGKKDVKTGEEKDLKSKWENRYMVLVMMVPQTSVDEDGNTYDTEYAPSLQYYKNKDAYEKTKAPKGGVDIRLSTLTVTDANPEGFPKSIGKHTQFDVITPGERNLKFAVHNVGPHNAAQWLQHLGGAMDFALSGNVAAAEHEAATVIQAIARGKKARAEEA